mmetsp:Transcript_2264/g.8369  ORF Transcript_2264/g.8369 Transcript_2264/m.8369 type:complete len:625 (-) Transcript_2264:1924-3798(-)
MSTGNITITPLGAGQDVGRSCLLVHLARHTILLDCGMHMGYKDKRRFPDFSYIAPILRRSRPNMVMDRYTRMISCVIVSHFHLDHSGALPYFTEVCGYNGPIYMTYPTKAIAPILLQDLRKISLSKDGSEPYTSDDITRCMKKVRALNLHETIVLDGSLEITPYYAGHVLGAAMFHIKCLETGASVLYTGDYNMTPDRHLGAATLPWKLKPDILITESTYATTVRDSKASRERQFLNEVHQCVTNGGKVLIPVFALGRAQELCILLETHWERMNLKVPIYFSEGMVSKANFYYKLFINWTNEKIRKTFVKRNMFDFKHIQGFDRAMMTQPGPMVVFATPGMLHSGMSLEIFKLWAPHPQNLVILPGYCVAGTVGNKVLHSTTGKVQVDNNTVIDMRCSVSKISFSAHADAKGILRLIRQAQPKNVVLVHGEGDKMKFLGAKIEKELKIPAYYPANGERISIPVDLPPVEVSISQSLIEKNEHANVERGVKHLKEGLPVGDTPFHGILISDANGSNARIVEPREVNSELGIMLHQLRYATVRDLPVIQHRNANATWTVLSQMLLSAFDTIRQVAADRLVYGEEQVTVSVRDNDKVVVTWNHKEESHGLKVLSVLDQLINTIIMNE